MTDLEHLTAIIRPLFTTCPEGDDEASKAIISEAVHKIQALVRNPLGIEVTISTQLQQMATGLFSVALGLAEWATIEACFQVLLGTHEAVPIKSEDTPAV